jgi:hypothetical protein
VAFSLSLTGAAKKPTSKRFGNVLADLTQPALTPSLRFLEEASIRLA